MSRLKKLLEKLKIENLETLLVSNEKNVSYISGFTGDSSILLVSEKGKYLITDFRYIEQAEVECPEFEIIKYDRSLGFREQLVNKLVQNIGVQRMCFEQDEVNFTGYEYMVEHIDVELIPTKEIVEDLRYIKDAEEIECTKKAAQIADQAFSKILDFIKPGLTEKEVATELEYYMKKAGADGIAFETILLSGVKTSLPHGKPSDKKIEEGDFITLDFGALYNGYRSDMTRTIVVGKINQEQEKIYNIVKEAQEKALNSIRAGVMGSATDKIARDIIGNEGYRDNFGHGLGHGVGLVIHEEPFMGPTCTRELKENCVVTVEPGIYIPNWGGVRIEDTVVVTKDGCEILTKSSKELIILK